MLAALALPLHAQNPPGVVPVEQAGAASTATADGRHTLNLRAEHYTPYLLVLCEGKAS